MACGARSAPVTTITGRVALAAFTAFLHSCRRLVRLGRAKSARIDLTAPEAYYQFDLATKDIAVFGRDSLSGVPAGPIPPSSVITVSAGEQLRTYNVTDRAGNVLQLVVRTRKVGRSVPPGILCLGASVSAIRQEIFDEPMSSAANMLRLSDAVFRPDDFPCNCTTVITQHFLTQQR